jgi:hypothetical protein
MSVFYIMKITAQFEYQIVHMVPFSVHMNV